MPVILGQVGAPSSTSAADSTNIPVLQGKAGDFIASQLHGKAYTAGYRGRLFTATATAVTVPVITSAVVSVFTLYNPPGSGVNMEMIETTIGQVLAATVVNTVGWYYSTAAQTAAGTFTTAGTVQNLLVTGGVGQGKFFSAYTHNGTPTLIDIVASFGSTTNTSNLPATKFYDGRLLLPPGIAMSICASTAALTSSGTAISASWSEWPV